MKLVNFIKRFNKDEDGAVTVDWVTSIPPETGRI